MFKNIQCSNLTERFRTQGQPIVVNEIFGPTIQGEGKSIGKEVMFLRTSGCNLTCVWCDTPYTWDFKKFDKNKETHQMNKDEIIANVRKLSKDIKSLVLSGGEPLLQQEKLLPLVRELKKDNFWLEIETNGTITPSKEFLENIDQINCSPKLSNSGDSEERRIKPKVLEQLAKEEKTNFKFVVSSEEDKIEIINLIKRFQMKDVYLMAEGKTKKEQEENQSKVEQIAKELNVNFSPRLHVLKWDNTRGV